MDCLAVVQGFAGPVATIIAAGAAVYVTWKLGSQQLEVAKQQAATAAAQKEIAAGQLNLALYKKRYKVFEAAQSFLVEAIQSDHPVDAGRVMRYNTETADAVFLFSDDIVAYLDGLRRRMLQLRVSQQQLKAIEERDDPKDDAKRDKLIDRASEQHLALSKELPVLIEQFKPYLRLGALATSAD